MLAAFFSSAGWFHPCLIHKPDHLQPNTTGALQLFSFRFHIQNKTFKSQELKLLQDFFFSGCNTALFIMNKKSLTLKMKVGSSSCLEFSRDQQGGMWSVNKTRLSLGFSLGSAADFNTFRQNYLHCKCHRDMLLLFSAGTNPSLPYPPFMTFTDIFHICSCTCCPVIVPGCCLSILPARPL